MKKSSAGNLNNGPQLHGLHGLPANLLDAVLSQLDASSQLPVFMTSKLLATALLRVVPRIKLTYPTPHDITGEHLRELAPFLTEALQKRRQPELDLTLQPASSLTDAIEQNGETKPAAAASDAARLVARMLGAVPLCGAVDSLTISWHRHLHLPWEPESSAALADSFPSLTSLTFHDARMSMGHLANAISHPLLLPRLLHLDILDVWSYITHEGQFGSPPFIGSRLQTLKLKGLLAVDGEEEFLSGLLPFPTTLTQLEVKVIHSYDWDWVEIGAAVSSLTQLQQLWLYDENVEIDRTSSEFMALLPALAHLPSLHTLVMFECVVGQEQLDTLLALTKITSLEVLEFSGLTSSRASAACSWRRLKVWDLDWVTAAYLPLHSLIHPLELRRLVEDIEKPGSEVLAAAEHNLCECNKAGLVLDEGMCLSKATVDLLTEQYLSHSRRTAQHLTQPTLASSSSHSGPSTSLASSSHSGPSTSLASSSSSEGHITAGGPGSTTGQGGQQGSATGAQPLMQRLGRYVKELRITKQGEARLSSANQHAIAALFPVADIVFRGW